jgi:hypothetical protein
VRIIDCGLVGIVCIRGNGTAAKDNTMAIWILRPVKNLKNNPWEPWFDKSFGFVVRADSEAHARSLAHKNAGDENGHGNWGGHVNGFTKKPWIDPQYSTCKLLMQEGRNGIVMKDFASS